MIVFGPTDNGNGALDCGDGGNSYKISGGLLLAVGVDGMAESADGDGQAVIAGRIGQVRADTLLSVKDAQGNTLLAAILPKDCSHLVFSSPALSSGESYEILSGGDAGETVGSGYLPGATVTGGQRLATFSAA